MTKTEFAKIIAVLKGIYADPRFIADKMAMETWYVFFKDYSFETIMEAANNYIRSDDFGKPPVPGQIIANIRTGKTYLNEEEAWNLVYKGICNSNYCAQEEFNKLPIECQRAIASPYNMRELASLDIGTVQSVEKSHFIKTYRAEIERQMKKDKTPEGLLEIKQAQIGAKDDEIRQIESVG